jgi:hypothetical protein
MSTPERQQDPGEHGYGGTKQDLPAEERQDGEEHRLEDDEDARARESADASTRAGGFSEDDRDVTP